MLKKAASLVLVLGVAFVVMLLTTRSSTFVIRDSLLIDGDAARIWSILADVERWPQWWPGVETARLGSVWGEGEPLELVFKGNPVVAPARIERFRPGRELAFSREGVLGSRAGTALRLELQAGAVRVEAVSTVHGPQAFLARFTGREAFAAYHQRLLDALGTWARHGEFPPPEKDTINGR